MQPFLSYSYNKIMNFISILSWFLLLFFATGLQTAMGQGYPGAIILMAMLAGFWRTPLIGGLVGIAGGLCESAINGQSPLKWCFIMASFGIISGFVGRNVATNHYFTPAIFSMLAFFFITLTEGIMARIGFMNSIDLAWRHAAFALILTLVLQFIRVTAMNYQIRKKEVIK